MQHLERLQGEAAWNVCSYPHLYNSSRLTPLLMTPGHFKQIWTLEPSDESDDTSYEQVCFTHTLPFTYIVGRFPNQFYCRKECFRCCKMIQQTLNLKHSESLLITLNGAADAVHLKGNVYSALYTQTGSSYNLCFNLCYYCDIVSL